MKQKKLLTISLIVLVAGCRGDFSSEPPVHLNPNMDDQVPFKPQEANDLFKDGRSMRPLVPNTIARGFLKQDDHSYRGKIGEEFAKTLPLPMSKELIKRGQDRYNIYCTPCHGAAGVGDGMVVRYGLIPPPNFHEDRVLEMPAGQVFDVISNGARTMPAYGYAIPPEDRWAIVSYVKALQLSRRASINDVPAEVAKEKGWKK